MSHLFHGDRFSEVPGAVNIGPPEDGHVVGEELEGDDAEDPLETVHGVGNLQEVPARHLLGLQVPGLADEERLTASGHHLEETAETLAVERVPGQHEDAGHLVVHQSQRAVLQLPGQDPLAVHVGQLLDLQGALQTGGVTEMESICI